MVVVRINGTINKLYTNPYTYAIKGVEGCIIYNKLLTADSFWREDFKVAERDDKNWHVLSQRL